MLDDQGKPVEIEFPLLVGFNVGTVRTVNPTILGVDFLKENRFALYFDPANEVGYLEKKE